MVARNLEIRQSPITQQQ